MGDGQRVGPYRIGRRLGQGATATVYLARHDDGSEVALKRMHDTLDDERSRARFVLEGATRIDHPNVVAVRDSGVDEDGNMWIAFELLTGETLGARLVRGSITIDETFSLALQVCEGLSAVHAAGLIHRDLKPSNLFLLREGGVKLIDFGVALGTVSAAARITASGSIIGTPTYLAPEQASGALDIDARADIWAMGVLLYRCVAGHGPFERGGALETMLAIVREDPEPLANLAPSAPRELCEVVHRCLQKRREDRFADVGELAKALAHARGSGPSERAPAIDSTATREPSGPRIVSLLLAHAPRDPEAVTQAIRDTGGAPFSLYGGRIVGLWGAAVSLGDEATRAARAALRARAHAPRIAVVLGRVLASEHRLEGEALSKAESLCAARTSGVVTDDAMHRAIGGAFVTERIGPRIFRIDREDGAEVTEPPSPSRATHGTQPERAPIVDREAERATLREAFLRASGLRRAEGVVVVGSPGTGKSRLVRALLDEAAPDARIVSTRAEAFGDRGALSVFRNALLRVVVGHARTQQLPLDAALTALAAQHLGADLAEYNLDALARWLGLSSEPTTTAAAIEGRSTELDATAVDVHPLGGAPVAEQLRLLFWDLVRSWASERPVVLVVENAQWADPASLDLVDAFINEFGHLPLLTVVTTVPEDDAPPKPDDPRAAPDVQAASPPSPATRFTRAKTVRLGPLSHEGVTQLSKAVLGRAPDPDFCARLLEHTGGNPLFVAQILFELADQGARSLDAALPLPDTVAAVVQARLDRLSTDAVALCRTAAVLGRSFTPSFVTKLHGEDVSEALASLCASHLLTRRSIPGAEHEYAIAHAIVRESIERTLADGQRVALHRRMADALATTRGASPEEIAHHYERAGDTLAAVRYLERAVLGNRARWDLVSAVRCARKLDALGGPRELVVEVLVATAFPLRMAGRDDEARALVERAEGHVRTPRHELLVGGERFYFHDVVPTTDAEVERLLGLASDLCDPALLMRIAFWARGVGRAVEADRAVQRLDELARDRGDSETIGIARQANGHREAFLGRPRHARDAFREAATAFRTAGFAGRALMSEADAADCLNRVGRYELAVTELARVSTRVLALGATSFAGGAIANMAYAYTRQGRGEEALRLLEERTGPLGAGYYLHRIYLARAKLTLGWWEAAIETLGLDREQHNPHLRALALAVAAEASLLGKRPRDALRLAREAMACRDRIGRLMEDDGDVFLVLARAELASGRSRDAALTLGRANEWMRDTAAKMDDEAWSEHFLRDVPAHRELLGMAVELGLP